MTASREARVAAAHEAMSGWNNEHRPRPFVQYGRPVGRLDVELQEVVGICSCGKQFDDEHAREVAAGG
jgi:hypothetical protein